LLNHRNRDDLASLCRKFKFRERGFGSRLAPLGFVNIKFRRVPDGRFHGAPLAPLDNRWEIELPLLAPAPVALFNVGTAGTEPVCHCVAMHAQKS